MPIEFCQLCTKSFNRIGTSLICSDCKGQEKSLYQTIFQKLTPLLEELDYDHLSMIVRRSPQTIRNLLVYRLGNGQMPRLDNLRKGLCYLCEKKLINRESTEPVCIPCLKLIDAHVRTEFVPGDGENSDPTTEAGVSSQGGSSGAAPQACRFCLRSSAKNVCDDCCYRLATELKWYRAKYGDIPKSELKHLEGVYLQAMAEKKEMPVRPLGVTVDATTGETQPGGIRRVKSDVADEARRPIDEAMVGREREKVEEFLKILSCEEDDLPEASPEEQELLIGALAEGVDAAHLKRYGFKRINFK
jgi:hypothetical protein